MEFELQEQSKSSGMKAIKIIGLNIVLWTMTFVGFSYIPELFQSEHHRTANKLIAVIAMGPVIALVLSIGIGIKPQRLVVVGSDGIRYGDRESGMKHYPWNEIRCFNLAPNPTQLKLGLHGINSVEIIPLKSYGISPSQYKTLLAYLQQIKGA
jgi:hypothetical protein